MNKENSNCCKNVPHELTADDLYLTAKTPACPSTRRNFIETFGFDIYINDPQLKKWIKERNLENDFRDNLPDHYAVIFEPEWQPKINEIVWVRTSHEWIGRYTRKTCDETDKEMYQIRGQWGDVYWLEIDQIKPISERPFQVGDWVQSKNTKNIYKVVPDGSDHNITLIICTGSVSGVYRGDYELIISPAIPEVK